jgi:hypothetical protein
MGNRTEPNNDEGPCKHKNGSRCEQNNPGTVDIICVDCDAVIRTDTST